MRLDGDEALQEDREAALEVGGCRRSITRRRQLRDVRILIASEFADPCGTRGVGFIVLRRTREEPGEFCLGRARHQRQDRTKRGQDVMLAQVRSR